MDLRATIAGKETLLPKDAVPRRTIYLVKLIEGLIRTKSDAELRAIGLTLAQYTMLALLRGQAATSASLARRLYTTPQSANEHVMKLVNLGLISRQFRSGKLRDMEIELTNEGRAMLQSCDGVIERIEQSLFGHLTSDDLDRLRSTLTAVVDRFRKS